MNENNYLIKPLALIQDNRLTPLEQDYLCLIAQFEKAGGCIASNNYFAKFFKVCRQSAQGNISKLKSKGFISCSETKQGGKTIERNIKIIDNDSRNVLLTDSRERLPMVSRKSPAGLAGNSDKVGRKSPTPKLDTTLNIKLNTKKYSPASPEIRLSELLLSEILKRKPDYRKPDLQKWAREIDLMICREHRTPENIEKVILWAQADSGNGNGWAGWQNVILSTANLRKKFDQLELKMQKGNNNGQKLSANRRDYSEPVKSSIAESVAIL